MGYGDEIIACGQARARYAQTGKRCRILNRLKLGRWHELWSGVPYIVRPEEGGDFCWIVNTPGVRPYIESKDPDRWTWRPFPREDGGSGPYPGEIKLNAVERQFGARYAGRIIVDPHVKDKASPNKAWGWARWNKLAWLARQAGIPLTQVGPADTPVLDGIDHVVTPTFRDACAVIAKAKACVLHEGGLHHAAAALGIPAIVIFGGFISPAQTGYASHVNLFTGGEPCGARASCEHCAKAMAAIHPEAVLDALENVLA